MSMIVESVAETEQSDVASAASSSFKRISLEAGIAGKLLQPMRDFTPPVEQTGVKKRWVKIKWTNWEFQRYYSKELNLITREVGQDRTFSNQHFRVVHWL